VTEGAVEFALSTSMIQGDLSRLVLFDELPATHVEIGFAPRENLATILDHVARLGHTIGAHDPLPFDPRWRWPSLTDPDPAEQARSLTVMRATMDTAQLLGARYALTHFPSVHLGQVAGWSRAHALATGHVAASGLAHWSEHANLPVLLENVGPNPYWDASAWIEILEAYPQLGFCLDVGHLHLEHHEDNARDLDFAAALAPYTRQIHIYNATQEAYATFHHIPAHPSQDPADGWIDLPALLATVTAGRAGRPLRLVFEHTPQYPATDAWVREGMDWVRDVVSSAAATAT
jgi:sugar phosphate isomerase/epimerase